jgi:hypothetical protein
MNENLEQLGEYFLHPTTQAVITAVVCALSLFAIRPRLSGESEPTPAPADSESEWDRHVHSALWVARRSSPR